MKLIGAGLRHQVDRAACREAELRRHRAALHLELLDRIHGRRHAHLAHVAKHVVVAVEHLGVHRVRAAIDAERRDLNTSVAEARVRRTRIRDHTRVQQRQGQRVAAIQRQVGHAAVFNHRPKRRAAGIHQRGLCRYLDAFGNLSDVHSAR